MLMIYFPIRCYTQMGWLLLVLFVRCRVCVSIVCRACIERRKHLAINLIRLDREAYRRLG